ncbi:MAG TPA: amino acid adenylation domain-containing protein, partial [Longimicrobiaceae bacterium]|nr:amino acid adenylation domain-containing protein [Longimicrobiaceae bacterium]
LLRELSALYDAYLAGESSPLPDLPVQYADYAVWQRRRMAGAEADRQLAWWTERMAGAPPALDLPTDRPRGAASDRRGALERVSLPAGTADALRRLARGEGATLFMALLAGWQALLARYAGQEDVVVGTPVAGRTRTETEGLIGFFVNTLALRTDLSGDPTFRELLERVRETTLGAYAHQELPFERLVEALGTRRSLSHSPLFQATLALQTADDDAVLRLGAVEGEPIPVPLAATKFELALTLAERRDGIAGALGYRTALWDAETAARMLRHFERLLAAASAAPDTRLAAVPLLDAGEREQVLRGWNATAADFAPTPVHLRVAEQAARTPDAVAVVGGEYSLTYAALEERANRLASHLRGLGVGPETRVGICMERGPEMVAALLAVLGAGGAYVPLDPAYPSERLALMLEDSGAALVLTGERLRDTLPATGARVVCVDHAVERIARESGAAPEPVVIPDNLAYTLYTSGSTGRPKGVMVTHRSLAALMEWGLRAFAREELAGVLASTSISFDVSVFEIFLPLCAGTRVVLAENALALPQLAARDEVTLLTTVPSAAAELVRLGGIPASVRVVGLGGEALPRPLVDALYALPHVEKVYNLYGPTEDTVYSTTALVERGSALAPEIGRPVDNTRAFLLDSRLEPVPVGMPGELYLGGEGQARGYLGRPALTAERFVPDPLCGVPGARLYRTGDRARRRADGTLEYLGRLDHQVKLRGFRVEPGEVEAALLEHPAVHAAAVLVREDEPGRQLLAAYVVAGGGAVHAAVLRDRVARRVPEHMVPGAFVFLDALPLTPNGKIDRKALPAPDDLTDPRRAFVAPRTPNEELIAG